MGRPKQTDEQPPPYIIETVQNRDGVWVPHYVHGPGFNEKFSDKHGEPLDRP